MCLVGNKRAEIARVVPCENNFCTKYAHHLHFCGLQKLNTLNLRHFHPPLNPCNHFSTVLIKTNWYTISCKYRGCSGLTSLTLPVGITSIGPSAFEGCSGLTSLNLPAGITSIGSYAFVNCSGLTSIYVYAEKVPYIGSIVFVGVDAKKCTLYVPMGTRDDYRLSGFGNYFENIVEFEATGIDKTTTSTDVEEVARYSVNGQRLSAPTKGLNIVKYSDGSVKKVAVQ